MADIPRMVVMSLNRRRTWVVSGGGVLLVDRKFLERGRVSKPTASLPARNNDELANETNARTTHSAFTFVGIARSAVRAGTSKEKGRNQVWHTDAEMLSSSCTSASTMHA